MSSDRTRFWWTVTRTVPFGLRDKGDFHFVQPQHRLCIEVSPEEGLVVLCCDAGASGRGTPPQGTVLRRLTELEQEVHGEVTAIRGTALVEGAVCEVEMLISHHTRLLYGSIRRAKTHAGDDDATGVWTAEDEGDFQWPPSLGKG